MSAYGTTKLPEVVLRALDGGESRIGRIMLWVTGGLFAFMAVMFFVTPDPTAEKLKTLPWVLGVFALMFGGGVWIARKKHRVGFSALAKVLRDEPGRIVRVREQIAQPNPGGVRFIDNAFDGEREFAPRPQRTVHMIVFKMHVRSQIFVDVEGKLLKRKMVVPFHEAPELLSYLFALVAAHNRECVWGKQPLRELVPPAAAAAE